MVGADEAQPDANRLIREAAEDSRTLTPDELQQVLQHVAAAGFDPHAREAARGPLRGQIWNGQLLTASSRIPAMFVTGSFTSESTVNGQLERR